MKSLGNGWLAHLKSIVQKIKNIKQFLINNLNKYNCLLSIKEIKSIWKETFSQEEYEERIKKLATEGSHHVHLSKK